MGRLFTDRTYTSFDPEALRDVVHQSRIEHRLLGAGELELRVRNRIGPRFCVDAGDYACAVYARGVCHPQALTIGFAPLRRGLVFLNGRPLPPHALQVYAEGASLDYVSTHAASWRTLTVARVDLQAHAVRRLGRELALPAAGCVQFEPDPALTRQVHEQMEAGYLLAAEPDVDAETMQGCDQALLDAVTEALANAPSAPEPRGARTRRRIMEVVESVADLGAQSAEIDATALSRLCAASERLVEHAMRQGVGMPPQRWLTMARLNRVYVELADPGNTRSVTDTALHWGFNHLGRFASNYRAVFGESPSDTVSRVRGETRNRLTARVALRAA
jgi:AraC family ethanolamine operon transcriptional activator